MAKAYECDRCGKLYTRQDADMYDEGITETQELRLVTINPKTNAYYDTLDLCPECNAELNTWFVEKRGKTDESNNSDVGERV